MWHLGLGDAIICAPIIAKLASKHDEVIVPSWKHNEVSVQSFFVNHPNVKVVSIEDHNSYMADFADSELKLGVYSKDYHQEDGENFIMWFYRQAKMTQEERWNWCPIYEAALKCDLEYNPQYPLNETVFIQFHKDFRLKIFHEKATNSVPLEGSILRYAELLMISPEIHCIDSSFLHLAESLPIKGRLFYHQYARPNSISDYKFRKQWTIINA